MAYRWIVIAMSVLLVLAMIFALVLIFGVRDEVDNVVNSGVVDDSSESDSNIPEKPAPSNPDNIPDDTPEDDTGFKDESGKGDYSLTVTPGRLALERGQSQQLAITIVHSSGNLPLTVQSSNYEVVTVSKNGSAYVATAVECGEAIITVSYDDMEVSVAVTVNPRSSLTASTDIVQYDEYDFVLAESEYIYNTHNISGNAIRFKALMSGFVFEEPKDRRDFAKQASNRYGNRGERKDQSCKGIQKEDSPRDVLHSKVWFGGASCQNRRGELA